MFKFPQYMSNIRKFHGRPGGGVLAYQIDLRGNVL